MKNHTRTVLAAGAITLALGLTGCAAAPTENASATASPNDYASTQAEAYASAQAEAHASTRAEASASAEAEEILTDVGLSVGYRNVITDFQGLLTDLEEYVDDNDAAGMKGLGNDFVLAAWAGRELDDAPDLGRVGNKAWDDAMDDFQVMGGSLQVGMFTMAGDAMNDATENIQIATAMLNDANDNS